MVAPVRGRENETSKRKTNNCNNKVMLRTSFRGEKDTYVNVPNLWSLLYVEGKMKPVTWNPIFWLKVTLNIAELM